MLYIENKYSSYPIDIVDPDQLGELGLEFCKSERWKLFDAIIAGIRI